MLTRFVALTVFISCSLILTGVLYSGTGFETFPSSFFAAQLVGLALFTGKSRDRLYDLVGSTGERMPGDWVDWLPGCVDKGTVVLSPLFANKAVAALGLAAFGM